MVEPYKIIFLLQVFNIYSILIASKNLFDAIKMQNLCIRQRISMNPQFSLPQPQSKIQPFRWNSVELYMIWLLVRVSTRYLIVRIHNLYSMLGFQTSQTLPTRSGPGLSVGFPGSQPAGVASLPPDSRTS